MAEINKIMQPPLTNNYKLSDKTFDNCDKKQSKAFSKEILKKYAQRREIILYIFEAVNFLTSCSLKHF